MIDLRKLDLLNLLGERAGIRFIRDDDPEEMRRLVAIDMDENVRRYVLETTGDEDDLQEFARGTRKCVGIAVVGKAEHVGIHEENKLQGWIALYPDHPTRLSRAQAKGLLAYDRSRLYLEVGFARFPAAKPGQVGSALRQVIASLRTYLSKNKVLFSLTGYTHPNNEGSKRVLTSAGFRHTGELPYTTKDKHSDCFFILE